MSLNRSLKCLCMSLCTTLGGTVGIGLSTTLLSMAPMQSVHADTTATCAAAWSSSQVYTAGDEASESGINYKANWWTQGNDPATNNGGSGSGQPWTSEGSCSDSSSSGSGSDTGSGSDSGSGSSSSGSSTSSSFVFSPYKDVTVNLNWNTDVMQSAAATGTAIPVVGSGSLVTTAVPNLGAITLAFATGACGSETWGGVSGSSFASANISALDSAGVDYVISTGGAAGTFTCASNADMATFVSRYYSAHLVGIDYDIEGGQTSDQIASLVSTAAYAQSLYPSLRFSFTLATLAASDGSYGGLNTLGDTVVKAIQSAGLQNYTINLMTMDFGAAGTSVCVVVSGACEMGQSTIQAVTNLEHTYGIPASQIEVTPMIGLNDNTAETFTDADVDTVSTYALNNGLAGIHFWSLDRDTPCASNSGYASPICNSVSGTTALEYTKRFLSDLGE